MNTDTNQDNISPTADREFLVSCVIHAPAALAFNAWTESKQLEQWWGPPGFETVVHEMAVEHNGITRLVMRDPEGVEYTNTLVYGDITAARSLSYLQSDDSDPDNDAAAFDVTVRFEEESLAQTRVTMRMVFKTAAERDSVVNDCDAVSGANQTLERLDRFLLTFLP